MACYLRMLLYYYNKKDKIMKKFITIIALLVSFGLAQTVDPPKDPVKEGDRQLEQIMNKMPTDVKRQVQEAIVKAEQAAKMVQEAKKDGLNDKEIEALMEQKKVQARERAEEAVRQLEGLSDETKENIIKAMQETNTRMQERKMELKELKK